MPLQRMVEFLEEIGLSVRRAPLPEGTFLPGIQLEPNGLVIDEARLAQPGDILHEAGHLAVLTPAERDAAGENLASGPGEEMAAIAWSYAACLHLGLDAAVVFHDHGYKGGGASLRENFTAGYYLGVPLLQWYGLTREHPDGSGSAVYPRMGRWLRGAEE